MRNGLYRFFLPLAAGLFVLGLAACSLAYTTTPNTGDPTQTPLVVKETVLVIITPTSPPSPPTTTVTDTTTPTSIPPSATPTRLPPTATLKPSPTPITLINVPIEGGDPNNKFFALLVFPSYQPAATKSLWFRVYAHKPVSSKVDGENISSVDFRIENSNGETVHSRQEKQAGYCAFGGGEPDCTIWDFASNKYQWPDGRKIVSGTYKIEISVLAKDNAEMHGEATFKIQVP